MASIDKIHPSSQDTLILHDIRFCPKHMLKTYVDMYKDPICDHIKTNPDIKRILLKFKQTFPENSADIPSWLDDLFPRAAREVILELFKIPDFTLRFPYPS